MRCLRIIAFWGVVVFVVLSSIALKIPAKGVENGNKLFNRTTDNKIVEIFYHGYIDSSNPFWYLFGNLLAFFNFDYRRIVFQKESGYGKNGPFCKVAVFSEKDRRGARFSLEDGKYKGILNTDSLEPAEELSAVEVKTIFAILRFLKTAKAGDKISEIYKAKKNRYPIFISAERKVSLSTVKGEINAVYFEGHVYKNAENPEHFLEINFWVAESGDLAGQILKCVLKYSFSPTVILEISK